MVSPRICSIDGCGNKVQCRDYCSFHYESWYRTGDPLKRKRRPIGRPIKSIYGAVEAASPTQCWKWDFCLSVAGYGVVFWRGKTSSAHRIVCELAHGAPPNEGFQAAHSCHNPACINPHHLRWATPMENSQDRVVQRSTASGEQCHLSKLNWDQVEEIRRRIAAGERDAHIAADYNVKYFTIASIRQRKTWKEKPPPVRAGALC